MSFEGGIDFLSLADEVNRVELEPHPWMLEHHFVCIENLEQLRNLVDACIEAGLCEADVLRVYFAEEVLSFWAYFEGYAQLRRESNYAGYGTAVDRLVDRFERAN